MKKYIIVFFLLVSGVTVAEAQSMLNVRTSDNLPVNVAVDGRYFNKRGTSVTVGDLPPGRHFIQIYTIARNRRGRGAEEIIFEGRVKTSEGMVTLLTYDTYNGRKDVELQDINTFASYHKPVQNGMAMEGNNTGNFNSAESNNGQPLTKAEGNNDNQDNNNSYGASPSATGSLTDTRVDQLKTSVAAKKTDTEKTNLLKSELKNETMTTAQVATMMDWMSFESSKVELAKWAYDITVDKNNFSTLESKFTYKNYQDELDKFLVTK